jgi:ribonuclease BN (tRNA processing enzyme)
MDSKTLKDDKLTPKPEIKPKPNPKSKFHPMARTDPRIAQSSPRYPYKKRDKVKTAYDIYNENAVTFGPYKGLPSKAARHTAIEHDAIQFDCGHVPREVGMNKLLVLITHFHSDHGSDVMNCVGTGEFGERVTIFCPAYCAADLFTKIRCELSMQKGRPYDDHEIVKIVRIIGCKRDNGEFTIKEIIKDKSSESDEEKEIIKITEINKLMSSKYPDLMISELVKMGTKTRIQLRGRTEVDIEPFACYHTVDTCGYVVHEVRKKMADNIHFDPGTYIDNNFTEDQMLGSAVEDIFKDLHEFQERHHIKIEVEMIDEVKNPRFTLKVRRLRFPDGMNIPTTSESGDCLLTPPDFMFFKKYKISYNQDLLIPQTMFFGDTCSYVFNPATPGYSRVMDILGTVETVIIESTFLEHRHEIKDAKFKVHSEKRHIFLFELEDLFKTFPQTKFLLIHFSDTYDRDTIVRYVDHYNKLYKNVSAFI